MGLLQSLRSRRAFCPGTQALVGRGPGADLSLDSRFASSPHALLHWTSKGWAARDIGSRNGTWLGEQRLEAGADAPIGRGAILCFGDRSDRWELVSAAPPGPAAVGDDGAVVAGASGLLALPDADHPLVLVLPDGEGWMVEQEDAPTPAEDGQVIEVDGRRYTLHLPATPVQGPEASTLDVGGADPSQVTLVFTLSQDEEHVDLEVVTPAARTPLSPRNHHFVLLALARAASDDLKQGVGPTERGWLYQDDLCRMVGVDAALLNLHLFRAREQLAAAGCECAARLIERRRLSRQVRLGDLRVEIRQG